MQLAKIVVSSRLCEHVLPRAGRVEALGVKRFVGRRHRVRFVVIVDECDAVAHVDGQSRRIVFEILDVDRRDGRKERCVAAALATAVRFMARSALCTPVNSLLMWVHMPLSACADGWGHPKLFSVAYQGREPHSVARHVISDSALAEDCLHEALVRVWRFDERGEETNGRGTRAALRP
jgi:hypothetical protein